MNNISIVIPARYNSSRFPGKPLAKILGKEMIVRVCDICSKVLKRKNIYVATDDNRISAVVKKKGYNFIKTKEGCLTGTDRVFYASKKIKSNLIINVQGDEPIIDSADINKIIKAKKKFPHHVICGFNKITLLEAKNKKNYEIYKQVCIYAFNKKQLAKYGNLKRKGTLEKIEDIELLRFLDLNIPIKMIKVNNRSIAVDVIKDIKKVESFLKT